MECEAGRVFCEHLDFAYGVALAVTRDPAEAEEVVQEAFLRFAASWESFDRSRPARPYLARAVEHAAADRARRARRRAFHEGASGREGAEMQAAGPAYGAEEKAALRAALYGLDGQLRLAVTLHYLQGLSVDETAEAMEVPRSSAGELVQKGVAELRKAMMGAGFAAVAAPAVMGEALGALPQPAAPAALKTALAKLAATKLTAAGGSGALAGAAKGGLLMKIGLGIAAAGLVAGGVFWAVGVKSGEPAKPPPVVAEKKSKFDIPVWHPDARWVKDPANPYCPVYMNGGALDGPISETIRCVGHVPSLCAGLSATWRGGRWCMTSCDLKTGRYHGVTADDVPGYLDGPFSRARFYGTGYVPRQNSTREVLTPDRRYVYLTSMANKNQCLRCLDFVEQKVTTLPVGSTGLQPTVSTDGAGRAYVVNNAYELVVLDPKTGWKPGQAVKLQAEESLSGISSSIAADEVHGRLYATTFGGKKWYVWYWDMKDGSFHGLVPIAAKGEPVRPGGMGGATPGPFKGVVFYGEGTMAFGPDDPEKRYLYYGQVDDLSLYRLDLTKEEIWMFDPKGGRFTVEPAAHEFVIPHGLLPVWLEDGSFVGELSHYSVPGVGHKGGYFRRIK